MGGESLGEKHTFRFSKRDLGIINELIAENHVESLSAFVRQSLRKHHDRDTFEVLRPEPGGTVKKTIRIPKGYFKSRGVKTDVVTACVHHEFNTWEPATKIIAKRRKYERL